MSRLVLVFVISNARQQWQQSADGAEVQLFAHGRGEAGIIRMPTASARADECDGRNPAENARTGAGGCVREHSTQHGQGNQESEKQMVSSKAREIEDFLNVNGAPCANKNAALVPPTSDTRSTSAAYHSLMR
jgi:hypothetical protein